MAFTSLTSLSPYTFIGATSGTRGAGGLIPTPEPGDQVKVLQGNGTWATGITLNNGNVSFENAIIETSQNSFSTSIGAGLNFDVAAGTVFLGSGSTSITGFNFTNVPTTNNKVLTISAMLLNTGSYTYGDVCTINGVNVAGGVRWQVGVQPVATSGTDILTFSIARDNAGNTRVFGFGATNLI